MATRIFIFFAFILIAFIKSDLEYSCEKAGTPSDKNECFSRISEDDKEEGWHCCYAIRITTATPASPRRVSGSTGVPGAASVSGSTNISGSTTGSITRHHGRSTSKSGSASPVSEGSAAPATGGSGIENVCELLDEDEYNDINSYAQELQSGKDYTVTLECYQKYVTFNLLFLIILFYF